jgi:glycosyltransferase involved in cell wall biosynthesis
MQGLEVEFQEQVTHEVKARMYAGAFATLFPIRWPEPFGLVMAESMVTGTPVVAYRNGAVPEVIDDGRTGYICDGPEEAADAVRRVREIDRRACRERVERLFSAERNVERHEELYRRLLTGTGSRAPEARGVEAG